MGINFLRGEILNLKKRNHYIDMMRGISLISMILYHLLYDLVYIFNVPINFYNPNIVKHWQLSICISFILISGLSLNFYKGHKKQGLIIFGISLIISFVTFIFIPEETVKFGILSLIGVSMILVGFLNKFLNRINPYAGFFIFIFLFLLFFSLPNGSLGLEHIETIDVPNSLYSTNYLYPIGLPHKTFSSADYFPIFPWFFLFLSGYYLGIILKDKNLLKPMGKNNLISAFGRNSLFVYIIHQPILYAILFLIIEIILKK